MDEIAKLCKAYGVGHLINNAYGLQCAYITKLINRAVVVGRVDAGVYLYLCKYVCIDICAYKMFMLYSYIYTLLCLLTSVIVVIL